MSEKPLSPLIDKYLDAYEKDKSSRVFAPLADCFREAGLIDRALEILRHGIKENPNYSKGLICLSHCYFDMGEFQQAYKTMKPLVSSNKENIKLQKLYAQTCLKLGHEEEALKCYDYLAFLSPLDKDVLKKIKEIRKIEVEDLRKSELNKFNVEEINPKPEIHDADLDEWIQIDFKKNQKSEKTSKESEEPLASEKDWSVENISEVPLKKSPEIEIVSLPKTSQKPLPVITHGLVDLYLEQGYLSKAKELLEKILELNPSDTSSVEKIKEINKLEQKLSFEQEKEEDGRQRLMDTLDEKLGTAKANEEKQKVKLQNFLISIKHYAKERESRALESKE